MDYPKVDELQRALDIFRKASLPVHITELDLGILPRPSAEQDADISRNIELAAKLNPYTDQVPQEVLDKQASRYKEIFEVLFIKIEILLSELHFGDSVMDRLGSMIGPLEDELLIRYYLTAICSRSLHMMRFIICHLLLL